MAYETAATNYWFKDIEVPVEVKMSIHSDNGYARYYFHDQTPGNFLLVIATVNVGATTVDLEYHWSVGERNNGRGFNGRDIVTNVRVANIMHVIGTLLTATINNGFGHGF